MTSTRRLLPIPLALFLLTAAARADDPVDLVIENGWIVDGTGADPIRGDVAVRGDRIVAVGEFDGAARLRIDGSKLTIAPGFIDLHNHSDRQIVDKKTRANINYVTQGCTTVVTGNCGSGPIDVAKYYQQIEAAGAGTNVAHLIPQGSLREHVVGLDERGATAEEIAQMVSLVRDGMTAGAWGISSGLIYVPSSYANTTELVALATETGRHNGLYASHIRNEGLRLLAAVDEAMRIGREGKARVHISHFKSSGRDAWGLVRQAARQIEMARASGAVVTADQYPYPASSTSLTATLIPEWARAGGNDRLLERLDDDVQGKRIRDSMTEALGKRDQGATIQIARYAPRQDWVGNNLAAIAQREKKTSLEIALEITRNGGAAIVSFSMSEDDVRHIMKLEWVATASDGRAYLPGADKPHPRNYGTFPRKIGRYVSEEEVISLPHAVRSSTGLPADILGLDDRGYIREGLFADIVAFDREAFRDRATFRDPHQYSAGVRYVLVNGVPVIFDGNATGALPGRPLRHRSPTE